jgi:hypothetical protein
MFAAAFGIGSARGRFDSDPLEGGEPDAIGNSNQDLRERRAPLSHQQNKA